LIILAGLAIVIRSYMAFRAQRPWGSLDTKLNAVFIGSLHLQLLLGLLLYTVFSPITETAFADFGAAMKAKELRFWAVEHPMLMFLSIIIAQVGSIMIKKTTDERAKYKRAMVFYGIALVLFLSTLPFIFIHMSGRATM
jgi:hypothetical protein